MGLDKFKLLKIAVHYKCQHGISNLSFPEIVVKIYRPFSEITPPFFVKSHYFQCICFSPR